MTATVSTSRKSRSADGAGTTTRPGQRSARSGRGSGSATPEGRSAAAQKAYERRERRTGSLRESGGLVARGADSRTVIAKRIPFVALVLALLFSGMGLTLWLSTNSTAQSYAISAAQKQNQDLRNRKAALEQAVEAGNSAPVLARKAAEQGMVQSSNVPRLVVDANGAVRLEGKPGPANGPAPSPLTSVRPESATVTPPPAPPVTLLPPVQIPTVPVPVPPAAAVPPAPVAPAPAVPPAPVPPAPVPPAPAVPPAPDALPPELAPVDPAAPQNQAPAADAPPPAPDEPVAGR